MPAAQKVCVIGAGSSGIAACQVLGARSIAFDCFEKGSQVGGNWRYENDNGMSSAYRSLHINTSRKVMAFKALPMPDHYPDYPNHFQMAAYFDEYVDHFGLRDKIRFRTEALSGDPGAGAGGGGGGARGRSRQGRAERQPLPRRLSRQRTSLGSALARTRLPRLRRVQRRADSSPPLPGAGRPAGDAGSSA